MHYSSVRSFCEAPSKSSKAIDGIITEEMICIFKTKTFSTFRGGVLLILLLLLRDFVVQTINIVIII